MRTVDFFIEQLPCFSLCVSVCILTTYTGLTTISLQIYCHFITDLLTFHHLLPFHDRSTTILLPEHCALFAEQPPD